MRNIVFSLYAFLGMMLAQTAGASLAMANITEKDVALLGRLLGLMESVPKGTVQVAVITDGPAVQRDVGAFTAIVGSGKTINNLTLTAVSLRADQVGTTNAKVILIPEGLSSGELDQIFSEASRRKLVTISTSKACLAAQKCAIAIKSEPTVDIQVSAAAANATNVNFGGAMRLMIKEVP